jgi:hypothetical protein
MLGPASAPFSPLESCLQREYAVALNFMRTLDFREGVRAVLVDRTTPQWRPATLVEVNPAQAAAFFVPTAAALQFEV